MDDPLEPFTLTPQDLLTLLDVRRTGELRFEGDSAPFPNGHVFGGQVMGQALVAAGRTTPAGRRVHSMYSYFLSPADAATPLIFTVDVLRDGGSFSVRHVRALQGSGTVLEMTTSFQEEQTGRTHQVAAPQAPAPESLPSTAEVLAGIDHPAARYWSTGRPFDIRHVSDPIYLRPSAEASTTQMAWVGARGPYDAEPLLHDAVFAFTSDYTPFEPILRRQGLAWVTPGVKMATINHALWWHSHPDADEWLLHVQTSPSASGGRGLTTGQVFRRDGSLVASMTQEGMLRAPAVD